MKRICNCYEIIKRKQYTYHPVTGTPIGHDIGVGVCNGTKEREQCSCDGNEGRCDFYAEVRKRAKKSVDINDAISYFKYGISRDIFSEPVITYAKLAIDALEKQFKNS